MIVAVVDIVLFLLHIASRVLDGVSATGEDLTPSSQFDRTTMVADTSNSRGPSGPIRLLLLPTSINDEDNEGGEHCDDDFFFFIPWCHQNGGQGDFRTDIILQEDDHNRRRP
jgi:hypothetical protein